MNILMISPETPSTFWSFRNALKFVSKKSSEPPLGLTTVAAMLPEHWHVKLIDMNVRALKNKDLLWADLAFITGMNVQRASFQDVVSRCQSLNVKIVAGGPMMTTEYQSFTGIDHFILNEAEETLPPFLKDLEAGCAKPVYSSKNFPKLHETPLPRWDLLEKKKYASMSVQYSRGCPFDCEFCSITLLNGHRPRAKNTDQFLAELESLYQFGWRGPVFIVDDNFIGHKKKLKTDLLPALIQWSEAKKYPFRFTAEVSMNLADDESLIQMLVHAGFEHVFIGIETPNTESLAECGKSQNLNRDMSVSVHQLQKQGLRVSGGFIVGFDHDPPSIFERQIQFIRKSGIVTAMVGILNAPSGSKLFQRMSSEKRLLGVMSGDNMDGSTNFIPKMNPEKLSEGYKKILKTIYSPREYYIRVKSMIQEFRPFPGMKPKITLTDIKALFKSMWILGVLEKGKLYYWRLFLYSLFKCPEKFPLTITLAIYGFHFRKIVEHI
ncbi:B12-binding domain-containing radical SAM protein [candidate division KSB1 bacterium]|nr:B12-binding domain-containing radical SAM protein [candidate division KSB1 bacterium]